MRMIALGLAVFLLASCGGNDVPSPAERKAGAEAVPEVDPELVAVHGQGIVAGAEAFYFAAGKNEVEGALADMDLTALDIDPDEFPVMPHGTFAEDRAVFVERLEHVPEITPCAPAVKADEAVV